MPFLSCHVATPCLSPLLCTFPQHKGLREVMPGPPLSTRSCQGYPVDVFKKLDHYGITLDKYFTDLKATWKTTCAPCGARGLQVFINMVLIAVPRNVFFWMSCTSATTCRERCVAMICYVAFHEINQPFINVGFQWFPYISVNMEVSIFMVIHTVIPRDTIIHLQMAFPWNKPSSELGDPPS